jgi:hypothetical protein
VEAVLTRTASALLAVTLGLGAVSLSCQAEQPRVQCTASRSTFAARYKLVEGTGRCAELIGDLLGVQAYVPDPLNPGDRLGSVAIKSEFVASKEVLGRNAVPQILDPDPDHRSYALGRFTSVYPDANDHCHIPELSPAAYQRGAVPTNRLPDPPIHVTHQWKNVKFLVTPALTGVMMEADLTYTLGPTTPGATENECSAVYKVVALSPAASCDDGKLNPSQALCSPERDPNDPRSGGSGISPEFATECLKDPARDPHWVACFPAGPFPSLR